MEVYRICRSRNADLSGKGSKIAGGRWNSKSHAVIYSSENRSLAILELLSHFTDYIIPDDLVLLTISLPSDPDMEEIKPQMLPKNWKMYPGPIQLTEIGDEWLNRNETLILKVPSVIIENEYNYLINPSHKDIVKVKIIRKEKFIVDERLHKKI
jgi:RES domain-containing protein